MNLSKIAIVVIALGAGFTTGNLYYRYTNRSTVTELKKTRVKEETSVAINERSELMIFDRKTGSYEIYSDSVGKMVFNLYASKMYYESKPINSK